jgi:FtsP/CotA-like multicopper oxidase with cupredoxin domain
MDDARLTRRDALKVGILGAAALALPYAGGLSGARASEIAESRIPRPYSLPFVKPPMIAPTGTSEGLPLYRIQQRPFQAEILPGVLTDMWGYNGRFPGPTIRVNQNQAIVVRMSNNLPARHPVFGYEATTSTHLHGHPSRPQYDGYANDLTRPRQYKDYVYENNEDARTIWYHDHAAHHTAENVYWGLAAQYHVVDPLDLRLPAGRYDVPVVINDVAFTARGQLLYDDRSDSGPMGDVVLVNGRPWPVLTVERRKYRFRLLNASIARAYRLRLSTGGPMTVVSTDGGLVQTPLPVTELKISMAERYDVVIDFAEYPAGQRVELRNLGVDNSIDYDHTDKVMAFQVGPEPTSTAGNTIPAVLNTNPVVMDLQERDATQRRKLSFERGGSNWVINDQTWHDVERSGFRKVIANPAHDAVELWELENRSGGWFHPIHLHLVDFKILDRNGRPPEPYERGPKDVVYLAENETIRILAKFGPHEGRYMIHCHNNTHEDHDMMVQMQVGRDLVDPITAAPPRPFPVP